MVCLCVCAPYRDGCDPGADEFGHAAVGAEGLLRSSPPEVHEVQKGQLAKLPCLQARETWLGLLWTSGVSLSITSYCFVSGQLLLERIYLIDHIGKSLLRCSLFAKANVSKHDRFSWHKHSIFKQNVYFMSLFVSSYVMRMKEYERERRLQLRKKRIEAQAEAA